MIELIEAQPAHVKVLQESLKRTGFALDASDMGTGKTYCAVKIAAAYERILVVCPKAMITDWERTMAIGGLTAKVVSYGTARGKKMGAWFIQKVKKRGKWVNEAEFLNDYDFVIFDEVHNCGGRDSIQGELLISMAEASAHCMGLSATIAESPMRLRGVVANAKIAVSKSAYWKWARSRGVIKMRMGDREYFDFTKNPENREKALRLINKDLFPSFGSRMTKDDMGDAFKDETRIAKTVDVPGAAKALRDLEKALYENPTTEEMEPWDHLPGLEQSQKKQLALELAMVPVMVEWTIDLVSQGFSVPVFWNRSESLHEFVRKIRSKILFCGEVRGGQTKEDRDKHIDDFQENRSHVIALNSGAGGAGVSLHDLNGRPRVSLILPPYSGVQLQQMFGRTHRSNALSDSTAYLCCAAGTFHDSVYENVAGKLNNIEMINDGDLDPGNQITRQ